jgi:hypothetical protein
MDTEREFCSLVDSTRSVRLAPLSLFQLERAKSRLTIIRRVVRPSTWRPRRLLPGRPELAAKAVPRRRRTAGNGRRVVAGSGAGAGRAAGSWPASQPWTFGRPAARRATN